jgi:hypothetical protein
VELARSEALAKTKAITVRTVSGEKFDRIVRYELGDKPRLEGQDEFAEAFEAEPPPTWTDDEIPF